MLAASVSVGTSGEIQAKLINYDARNASVDVQMSAKNRDGNRDGRLSWISGTSANEINSFDAPRHVTIKEKAVTLVDGRIVLELPAWSVSVLTVPRAEGESVTG